MVPFRAKVSFFGRQVGAVCFRDYCPAEFPRCFPGSYSLVVFSLNTFRACGETTPKPSPLLFFLNLPVLFHFGRLFLATFVHGNLADFGFSFFAEFPSLFLFFPLLASPCGTAFYV